MAEMLPHRLLKLAQFLRIADIAGCYNAVPLGELRSRRHQSIQIPVGDAHLEAGIEKAPRRRKADAGSTAGDDGDTTGL